MTFPCEPLVLHLFWHLLLAAPPEHLALTLRRRGSTGSIHQGQSWLFGVQFYLWGASSTEDKPTSLIPWCIVVHSYPRARAMQPPPHCLPSPAQPEPSWCPLAIPGHQPVCTAPWFAGRGWPAAGPAASSQSPALSAEDTLQLPQPRHPSACQCTSADVLTWDIGKCRASSLLSSCPGDAIVSLGLRYEEIQGFQGRGGTRAELVLRTTVPSSPKTTSI